MRVGEKDCLNLMKEVGVSADAADVASMFKAFNGRKVEEMIAAGHSKYASMPAVSASASAPAKAAPAEVKQDDKKGGAKKKEEPKKVEEDDDIGFGDLF